MPAAYDASTCDFIPPTDALQCELFELVRDKQRHPCRAAGVGCRHGSHQHTPKCKYGYPFNPHDGDTMYDEPTQQWIYTRPYVPADDSVDAPSVNARIIPYHPLLLLIWKAHCNILIISQSAFSCYLLKVHLRPNPSASPVDFLRGRQRPCFLLSVAPLWVLILRALCILQYVSKMEPVDIMDVDDVLASALGLDDADPIARAFISSYIARPVMAPEAAWHLLGFPLIEHSSNMVKIIVSSPKSRTKVNTRSRSTYYPDVDVYLRRPHSVNGHDFDHMTIYTYFNAYMVLRTKPAITAGLLAQHPDVVWPLRDQLNNYIVPAGLNHCVRFTQPHPIHHTEEYFYTVLMRRFPSADDTSLLTGTNDSYLVECAHRGLWADEESLQQLLMPYFAYMLYQDNELTNMVETLRVMHPVPPHLPLHPPAPAPAPVDQNAPRQPNDEFQILDDCVLTDEQQFHFDRILRQKTGFFWLGGVPGAGKSLLVKRLIRHFDLEQRRTLHLSASTGAAATLLSKRANTVHSHFGIPGSGRSITSLSPHSDKWLMINAADVFIIDEFSMLSAVDFNSVMTRIYRTVDANNCLSVLATKLIIAVGDVQQLPCICSHSRGKHPEPVFCRDCHISNSPWWTRGSHIHLSTSVRQNADIPWMHFLNVIRLRQPTAEEIHHALGDCFIDDDEAHRLLATVDGATVLCTVHADVQVFNHMALVASLPDVELVEVPLHVTTLGNEVNAQTWLADGDFHRFREMKIGARVMITQNISLEKGLINGTVGIIQSYDHYPPPAVPLNPAPPPSIKYIYLTVPGHADRVKVSRTVSSSRTAQGVKFTKSTFPLTLAYSITGHKSQVCPCTCSVLPFRILSLSCYTSTSALPPSHVCNKHTYSLARLFTSTSPAVDCLHTNAFVGVIRRAPPCVVSPL